jgi:hypothetical protein
MEILLGVLLVVVVVLAGRLVLRGFRAGLTESSLVRTDQPTPAASSTFQNMLFLKTLQQTPSIDPSGDDSPADTPSGSDTSPSDCSPPDSRIGYSDSRGAGSDAGNTGTDGGGFGGDAGDAF